MWGLTHLKRRCCWGRLRAEGDDKRMRWLDGITVSMDMVWVDSWSWWLLEAWRAAAHGVAKSRTRLSEWTELNWGLWRAGARRGCFTGTRAAGRGRGSAGRRRRTSAASILGLRSPAVCVALLHQEFWLEVPCARARHRDATWAVKLDRAQGKRKRLDFVTQVPFLFPGNCSWVSWRS